jgi:GDP-mannose 6-dehydrogenase
MIISVFGLGYVGCVTAACLAKEGHTVIGIDVNPIKVNLLSSGISPVLEPGLDELVNELVRLGRLQVCMDGEIAIKNSDISLICVGTPSNYNGSLKLEYVEKVCSEIGEYLKNKQEYHVVVVRSTVLPGTVEDRLIPLLEKFSGKHAGHDFGVCMNPEFLREGTAITDFYHPGLIVIGEIDAQSGNIVQELYKPVDARITRTSIRTAEMVKYACNAFHALKIVFANEIGNLSKAQGIDGQNVMDIFIQDRELNISSNYLMPGFAFGGSCLPKDLRAILYRSKELDVECPLLGSILPSNNKQIQQAVALVERTGYKNIGILGLSFKPDTDDLRESPAIIFTETLLGRGYQISIYDDTLQLSKLVGQNKTYLEQEIPHIASLMCTSIHQLISQSEVIVIINGSKAFHQVSQLINDGQILIDLVGIAKNDVINQGSNYQGICW